MTGQSYQGKARKYAAMVDTKPWNVCYERPAVVSLFPDLKGKKVLDAGCGSGWYCEYLLEHGAEVVSIDLDPDFVELTKERVGNRAAVLQHDLSEPLHFAGDRAFDLVISPLVMHYLEDWLPTLKEFYRVLDVHGKLVFSTHHPFNDWKLFDKEDYFALELIEDEWDQIGKITFYRRPLTKISEDLLQAGFLIERILEPQPTEKFRQLHPSGFEKLSKNPWFIVFRAGK